ncbi:Zinc finger BED domain-containing protein DAYSLEEPER [Glycine max]|nr:Zinc finger BED domain-containing protein DAYSLEEPER [Glycine max]
MLEKFDSYWSVIHVIMEVATVLDPRYKLELLEFYFESIYLMDFFSQVNRIRKLCYDLVSKYQAKKHEDFTSSFQSPYVKKARTSTMKIELDHYFEEEVLPRSSDFDILMWWKLNELKYPTLKAIARHILTPHRSRLHYTTLETLMCSKSWLWNSESAGSRAIEESTLTNKIESNDEGGSLVSSITQHLQD